MNQVRVDALPCRDPLASGDLEGELMHRWLVWDAWIDGRRRVDLHPVVLTERAHEEAVHVALAAAALVSRAGDRAAVDATERARYKLPRDVERLAAASRAASDLGALVRVDLLLGEDGRWIACEVNADSPGGYNETLALPHLARVAGFRRGRDPTKVAAILADRLVAMSGGPGSPRGAIGLVYGTTWAEDLQVCAIVQRLVEERGGRALQVPPTGLRADGSSRGVSYRGERVAVLYRYYPVEYMDGQRNVEAIAIATERGELSSLSSFAVIHAQSKLAMARSWAFEPENARLVFPETFAFSACDRRDLEAERDAWVLKLDLSRVGEHVLVGSLVSADVWRQALEEIESAEAEGEVWIAQRFVPQLPIATPLGPRCITLGAYVLDGAFAGYFARLTSVSHCSHDALVLPVFVGAA